MVTNKDSEPALLGVERRQDSTKPGRSNQTKGEDISSIDTQFDRKLQSEAVSIVQRFRFNSLTHQEGESVANFIAELQG